MITRLLYGIVVVLGLLILWQAWSFHQVYRGLDAAAETRGTVAENGEKPRVTIHAFIDYSTRPSKVINVIALQAAYLARDTRIVFHPYPQDNELARRTAYLALAAGRQEKFMALHDALMRNERPLTDEVVRDMASRAGIDADQLLADAGSDDIAGVQNDIIRAAQALKITATPAFIFNKRGLYIPYGGFPDVPAFNALITAARAY